jgi:hypothetical protein
MPTMNQKLAQIALFSRKFNRQHLQLLLVLVTLAMLVLGAGAPGDSGGGGH